MQRVDSGDSVRVPLLWIAVLVSLLFHAGLLVLRWEVPDKPLPPTPDGKGKGAIKGRLQAQVQPSTPAVREQAPATPPQPPPRAERPPPKAARPPANARPAVPEVLLRPAPDPSRPLTPPPTVPAPGAAMPPQSDFSAMVRSNQERREGTRPSAPGPAAVIDSPEEEEKARRDRAVMANLGSLQPRMVGENSQQGGGIFQIKEMGIEYATFYFYGWNKEMRRKNTQSVEVVRGSNPSMALAVVRRMITIIREHEQGDFVWESRRLRRNVNLSARPRDNAELEAFLMEDFFRQ